MSESRAPAPNGPGSHGRDGTPAARRGDGVSRRDFLGTSAAGLAVGALAGGGAPAMANDLQGQSPGAGSRKPIVIESQGSFFAGGTEISNPGDFDPTNPGPAGNTLKGDHAYVQYQIPPNARELPLVLWHGGLQSGKGWESNPDGQEGYQSIFVRRGFAVLHPRSAADRQGESHDRWDDDRAHAR